MLDRNSVKVVSSFDPPSPGSAERKAPWRSEAEQFAAKASAEPKLLDCLAQALRSRHYSRRTEYAYKKDVKATMIYTPIMSSTGAARASGAPRTICRVEMKVSYTETVYSPGLIAEKALMLCRDRNYADFGFGGL